MESDGSGQEAIRLISSTVSYGQLLLDSMKSTYTDPFELQTDNVIFGLDKVNDDNGPEPKRRKKRQDLAASMANSNGKNLVQIPKYDNYMRNNEDLEDDDEEEDNE